MWNAGVLSLLVLLAVRSSALAATAEPSLVPEFDRAAARRPSREPAPRLNAPEPPPDAPAAETPANSPRSAGGESRGGEPRRPYVVLRSRLWMTNGTVNPRYSVQIPPELITPRAEVWLGETENRGSEGTMLIHSAELAPLNWLSLEAQYGREKSTGRYSDAYWIHAPESWRLTNLSNGAVWNNPNHEEDLRYASNVSSKRDWAAANLYVRLMDARIAGVDTFELLHSLDLALGAERFRQYSRLTALETTMSTAKYWPSVPLGPIAGFDSTYSAIWRGPHIGLREEFIAPYGFAFEGTAFWSPVMEYQGDGFDNFSAGPGGLRAQTPNFTDRARGTAIHFQFGLCWDRKITRIEMGYQRLYFYSRTGKRRYYYDDGSTVDYDLEYATAEMGGLYFGASLRF